MYNSSRNGTKTLLDRAMRIYASFHSQSALKKLIIQKRILPTRNQLPYKRLSLPEYQTISKKEEEIQEIKKTASKIIQMPRVTTSRQISIYLPPYQNQHRYDPLTEHMSTIGHNKINSMKLFNADMQCKYDIPTNCGKVRVSLGLLLDSVRQMPARSTIDTPSIKSRQSSIAPVKTSIVLNPFDRSGLVRSNTKIIRHLREPLHTFEKALNIRRGRANNDFMSAKTIGRYVSGYDL